MQPRDYIISLAASSLAICSTTFTRCSCPKSVALVGASDRAGSLGRSVFENLLAGAFKGDVYAVNPGHRRVFGQRAYATVAAIGKPIDLVVIAAPAAAVPGLLDDMPAGAAPPS